MSEIFHTHHEMARDEQEWTAPLLRLLGGSVIAHLIMLGAILYVPALRDAFMVANALAGFGFVSEDYEKTRVEYERATVINLAAQQLYYPAGYLQDQTALPPADAPQFVATYNPPPVRRAATPAPTPQPSPSVSPSPAEGAEDAAGGEQAAASPSPAEPKSVEEAERLAKESGAEKFPVINTKPFEDLLKQGKVMKDAGEIDLAGTLEMTVEADRQEDGKLANVKVLPGATSSNPKLVALATDFVSAISDSKVLAALKGTKRLVLKVKLDDKQLDLRVASDMTSADEASRMANGYGLLLFIGKQSKKGKDEEKIFESVKIANEASQIVLTFQMPRKDAGDLLSKLIKKNETAAPTPAT
ncbi:MAG: hypothetical protein LC800_07110 [Acidobacteria bacterium]|nr:hypothetical protein [Acidobacteriota bacterium]